MDLWLWINGWCCQIKNLKRVNHPFGQNNFPFIHLLRCKDPNIKEIKVIYLTELFLKKLKKKIMVVLKIYLSFLSCKKKVNMLKLKCDFFGYQIK